MQPRNTSKHCRVAFTKNTAPDILPTLVKRRSLLPKFAFIVLFVLHPPQVEALSFWDDTPDDTLATQLLAAMTPEEILGQTLMLGWTGQDPSPEIRRWVSSSNLGGVKVFGWNGADLPRLASAVAEMQRLATESRFGIPLLVATDQEGGWVRHVKGNGEVETSITPGNMAIGASTLPFDAYESAYYIGSELRALGINMNFAPTVDVYVNPDATVVGPRSFSSDPVEAAILSVAYYHGQEQTRVISTAKHFPGHGNATGDSHGILPVIHDSLDTLWARDLVPYRMLINEGLPAILSGHLSFPEVTGDGRPASLSPFFLNDVLRVRLGYTGVVITDDLYMEGALSYGAQRSWGISEIVVEALRVGNDMVMLSQTPDADGAIWRHLLEEFESDAAFRDRAVEAARSVIMLKLRYLKDADHVPLQPDAEQIAASMRTLEAASFFRDQAGRSITVVNGAGLPYARQPDAPVLLVGKDPDFLEIGAQYFRDAELLRLTSPYTEATTDADLARFRAAARRHRTIIFCVSDRSSLTVLQEVAGSDATVLVMSILSPVYLSELAWADAAIAVYGWGEESYRAGFSAILGSFEPDGRLPVTLRPPDEE